MNTSSLLRRLILGVVALSTSALVLGSMAAPAQAASRIVYPTRIIFSGSLIDGNGYDKSSTVGNGGSLNLQAGVGGYYYTGYRVKPHLSLQRKVGSKWVTVKSKISVSSKGIANAKTPAYSTSKVKATVSYRFKSSKYSTSRGRGVPSNTYSSTLKITYENQKYYSGMKAEAYNRIKPYCPATAIHVDGAEGAAGLFNTGGLLIHLSPDIAPYSFDDRSAVYLHECGHERQWLNWGGTYSGWSAMEKRMPKFFIDDEDPNPPVDPTEPPTEPIDPTQSDPTAVDPAAGDTAVFMPKVVATSDAAVTPTPRQKSVKAGGYGFDAVEHAADCASHSVDSLGYLGYGGYCNPNELAAGLRLMKGSKL